MKKLIGALVLGAMLVSIGIGCSGQTTPTTKKPEDKKPEDKKPVP